MANVLIVDDDAALREGLAETVADLGHVPRVTASGRGFSASHRERYRLRAARFANAGRHGRHRSSSPHPGKRRCPSSHRTDSICHRREHHRGDAARCVRSSAEPIGRLELDALLKRLPRRGIPLAADGASETRTLIAQAKRCAACRKRSVSRPTVTRRSDSGRDGNWQGTCRSRAA